MNNRKQLSKLVEPVGPADRLFCKAGRLAKRYGIHPKTIFRWADAGMIHRHKVNDRVCLFDQAEVEAFIESCRVGPNRKLVQASNDAGSVQSKPTPTVP